MDEKLDQIIELLEEIKDLLLSADESVKSTQSQQRELHHLLTNVRNDNSEDFDELKSALKGIREDLNYLKQRTTSRQADDERVIRSRRHLAKILRDYLKQEEFHPGDPIFFILFFLLVIPYPYGYPRFHPDKESYIFWREFIEHLSEYYG